MQTIAERECPALVNLRNVESKVQQRTTSAQKNHITRHPAHLFTIGTRDVPRADRPSAAEPLRRVGFQARQVDYDWKGLTCRPKATFARKVPTRSGSMFGCRTRGTRMALSGDIAATCGLGLLVPLQVKGLWQCVSLEWERYSVTNR